jgi:hypothetical protein
VHLIEHDESGVAQAGTLSGFVRSVTAGNPAEKHRMGCAVDHMPLLPAAAIIPEKPLVTGG